MIPHYEEFIFNVSAGTELVRETLEGKKYLVVPAVGIREGVWTGNQGAIFYPAEEIGKAPSNWDHKPVVVQHPKKKGKPFTAADKEMIDKYRTGILLNASFTGSKLTFKTWIEESRIKLLSPKVFAKIENKDRVEVSTGMLMEIESKKGVYNGKPYVGIAKNIQPDHLAILPDSVGACSVKDGAGLFATNESGAVIDPTDLFNMLESIDAEPREKVKEIINQWMAENELSYTTIHRSLNEELSAKFGEKGKYWNGYIRDLFQDRVVFYDPQGKLYQINYSVNEDKISLKGERKEVQAVVQYQPVTNEVKKMPIELTRVAAVIANKQSTFGNDDKDFLTNLDEGQFSKIEKMLTAATQNAAKTDPEEDEDEDEGVDKNPKKKKTAKKSLAETMSQFDPKIRRVIENGLKADAKERARCISIIVGQKNCPFKEETLKNEELFPTENLQGMVALIENERETAKKKKSKRDQEEFDLTEDEDFVENEDFFEEEAEDEEEEEEKEKTKSLRIGQNSGGKGSPVTNESDLAIPSVIDFRKAVKAGK